MPGLLVYADAVEHALDWLGGTPDALAQRDARRAVQTAYRELINVRIWSYLYSHDRVVTNPATVTGAVAYNQATRQLLIYGATWPVWAGPGCRVRVGVVTSDVQEQTSPTVLTMTAQVNWGASFDYSPEPITGVVTNTPIVIASPNHGLDTGDVVIIENVLSAPTELPMPVVNATWTVTVIDANTYSLNGSSGSGLGATPWDGVSGTWRSPPTTPYTLYQDNYLLPADFIKSDTAIFEGNFGGLTYSDPTDQLWFNRFTYSAGTPRFYCLKGDPLFLGRMTIGFWPYPDISKTIDFIYQRRSRDLRWEKYSAGTVTLGSGSSTVTGVGTVFDPSMTGSVLRIGSATQQPTSWIDSFPPTQELVIAEVVSPTELRLLTQPETAANVLYVISDPVDIEGGAMQTALLRGIEKQLSIARSITTENRPNPLDAYTTALREAMAADSRSYQGRAMGGQRPRWVNPKYQPADFFPTTR